MDAPDHYQTTYVSKTKIVVFYSLIGDNIIYAWYMIRLETYIVFQAL